MAFPIVTAILILFVVFIIATVIVQYLPANQGNFGDTIGGVLGKGKGHKNPTTTTTTSAITTTTSTLTTIVSTSATTTTTATFSPASNGTLIWYANFSSASNYPYFNPLTDKLPYYDTCNGTISVIYNSQRQEYVGYYSANTSLAGSDNCREYPLKSWHSELNLTDFYVELWTYIPSATVKDWVSFMTVAFPNDGAITVNMWVPQPWRTGQSLYVATYNMYTTSTVNQPTNGSAVLVPFDKWVKIGLEVHNRPSNQNSSITVYQNDVPVIKWYPTTLNSSVSPIAAVHFGLYVGSIQIPFSIYNADIALYNLTK